MAETRTKGRTGEPRPEKLEAVEKVISDLKGAELSLFINLRDIPVTALQDLRIKLKQSGATCRVVKNSLIRKALAKTGHEVPPEVLVGPTAIVVTPSDVVLPAKVLEEFSKEHEDISERKKARGETLIKAGFLGSRLLELSDIKRLASLPGREDLLANLAGLFQAPAQGLATAMNQVLAKTARAFGALLAQKESAGN